jgi:protein-glutamine gamma-glutamyltransferase
MPGDAAAGRSGLSNSMAPGKLSSLALSDEPAFRARFFDPVPAQDALYWRAIVLSKFDGQTWTQLPRYGNKINVELRGKALRYEVTLEPSNNRWLFALELPSRVPDITGQAPGSSSEEFELMAAGRLDQRVRYSVTSYPDFRFEADRVLQDPYRAMQLPYGFNPKTVSAGLALRKMAPADRVRHALNGFAKGGFVYTLDPPLLGRDSVDQFLFETRAGFCEHYAGAFVILMRAAGVPARVVTGYQGGEINPVDGFMTVRQSDAHAWAEVWIAGSGWIRVDPTAAVAPARVRYNLARAVPRKAPLGIETLGSLVNFSRDANSWLGKLRFQWSAINNGWNQWVLNYSPERQASFLATLADTFVNWQSGAALVAIALLLLLARAMRRRRQGDPVDALYFALCQLLGKQGLPRARDEGPTAYGLRIAASALAPEKKAALAQFLRLYSAHKYGPGAPDPALPATLKRLLESP